MRRRLWLETGVVREMLAACQSAYPAEACGLLGGVDGVAASHYGVLNVAAEPTERFEMDPVGQLEAFRRIKMHGEELIAIYHSHPSTAAVPSKADLRHVSVLPTHSTSSWAWPRMRLKCERTASIRRRSGPSKSAGIR